MPFGLECSKPRRGRRSESGEENMPALHREIMEGKSEVHPVNEYLSLQHMMALLKVGAVFL
jgi:hypothetical protein